MTGVQTCALPICISAPIQLLDTDLDNENRMADFSSRGPTGGLVLISPWFFESFLSLTLLLRIITADGRLKPDIVAPGQYIFSAKSNPSGPSCDGVYLFALLSFGV